VNRLRFGAVFFVIAMAFVAPVFSQDDGTTNPAPEDEGVKIFNYYKDCVVDIETSLVPALGLGNAASGGSASTPEAYESHEQYLRVKEYLLSGGRLFIDDGNKLYKDRISNYSREITLGESGAIQFGGSGSFIDGQGYILTAAHVVRVPGDELNTGFGGKIKIASYSYYVVCHSRQKKYVAVFRGADQTVDAGVLQAVGADPAQYRAANLGNSHNVQVGETVYALGFPYGLPPTLTSGIVSGVNVYMDMNYVEDFIQHAAPINPGNSGGPLINARGELIGINTAGFRGSDGLGFAVPLHIIDIDRLKTGDVSMNWFGLEAMVKYFARTGEPGNPGFQDVKRLNEETGIEDLKSLTLLANLTNEKSIMGSNENIWAVVNQIDEILDANGNPSPAHLVGFKKGDLITKVDGRSIRGGMDVRLAVRNIVVGVSFEVEFIRTDNGEKKDMKVVVKLVKKDNKN